MEYTYLAQIGNGHPDRDTYHESWESAMAAIGETMGWAEPVMSNEFTAHHLTDPDSTCEAVTVYQDHEECDADADGAYGPRILEVVR